MDQQWSSLVCGNDIISILYIIEGEQQCVLLRYRTVCAGLEFYIRYAAEGNKNIFRRLAYEGSVGSSSIYRTGSATSG